jgi:SAM-dependent methyltransferase
LSLPWPLPALLAWAAAWGLFWLLGLWGVTPLLAMPLAAALGVVAGLWLDSWWRRLIAGLGFPLSLLLAGQVLAPGAWLLLLALLLLIYPLKAWRDAPLFPTPQGALATLAQQAPLAPGAGVLDAGCGLGHGLRALRQAYPQAKLCGLEWSWPLRALCALRCPWAEVRQGDIWQADWSPYALVYLFQRPESMARALAKARTELAPGAWLVSLEFPVPDVPATACLPGAQGKPVWVYQMPR